jgi:hypothetical protein
MPSSRARSLPSIRLLSVCIAISLTACASTPSPSSELAVRKVWDEYLASKKGQFKRYAGEPSPLWDPAEQQRWPMYDLAGFYLNDGAIAEVLSVTPVNPRADTAYQIVTRFWPAGATTRDASSKPELTMTVYARRHQRRWVLANALPYQTSSWTKETRGRVTYRVAPALRFDATRANRSAAFIDSLAAAFELAPPERLDYYVAESVDQALEILGVEVSIRYGAAGGFAKPVNLQVFSGIPALGEEYRHEIAHVVLQSIIRDSETSLIASEGVSTWFGGTAGRDYRASVRHMDSLLIAQPAITLDRIVDDMSVPSEIRNAAGAVFSELLHEIGGIEAVREYMRTPGSGIRAVLTRLLQRSWPDVVVTWRQRVSRLAGT